MAALVNGARGLLAPGSHGVVGMGGGLVRTPLGILIGVASQWERVGAGGYAAGQFASASVGLMQGEIPQPHPFRSEGSWKGWLVHDLTQQGSCDAVNKELANFLLERAGGNLAGFATTRTEGDFYVRQLGLWLINSGGKGALFFPRELLGGRRSWHLGPYV